MDDSLSEDIEQIFTAGRSHETFVQFYNLTIKSFKGSPEYVSIIKDMKKLISMDESELEKRIKNVTFDIKNFNNAEEDSKHEEYFDKAWSGIDLKSEIDFLKKMPLNNLSPDEHNVGYIFLFGELLAAEYDAKFEKEELLEKNKGLVQFLSNISMELNLKKLIISSDFWNTPIDVICNLRDIGADYSSFDSTEILQNHQLQDLMHKIISSRIRYKGHAKRHKKYEAAIAYAEDMWANGDKRNIKQMAEYLTWQDEFDGLSFETLKVKLRPIAEKYDKLVPRGRQPKKKR